MTTQVTLVGVSVPAVYEGQLNAVSNIRVVHFSPGFAMRLSYVSLGFVLPLAFAAAPAAAQSEARPRTPLVVALAHNVDPRLTAAVRIDSGSTPRAPVLRAGLPVPQGGESHRTRNALIGGVIGSAVGVGVCTGFSSLMNDSAKGGFSTCTAKGNIAFAAGGFAVGALIGAVVR